MIKLLKSAIFVIPIVAIIAAPAVLPLKNKTAKQEAHPHAATTSTDNVATFTPKKHSIAVSEKKNYAMPEPFAENFVGGEGFANGMTYSMRKSMDPNTWMQMMMNMMNPQGTSLETMCASCHEGDDLARYEKQFGPMLQPSWDQYKNMMDPHGMSTIINPMAITQMMHQMMTIPMQMMVPMMGGMVPMAPSPTASNIMDPKQYEKWYNKQQEKLEQSK